MSLFTNLYLLKMRNAMKILYSILLKSVLFINWERTKIINSKIYIFNKNIIEIII